MVSELSICVRKWSKIAAQKKFFLLTLPYKTCWKPHFLMDKRPLDEGYIANFGIPLDVFEFLRFGRFFPFFKQIGIGNPSGSVVVKRFIFDDLKVIKPDRLDILGENRVDKARAAVSSEIGAAYDLALATSNGDI